MKLPGSFFFRSLIALTLICSFSQLVGAFFQIPFPKPKLPKSPSESSKTQPTTPTQTPSRPERPVMNGSGSPVPPQPVPTGPTLLKMSLDVRADTLSRYWKLPNESFYSSWVPQLKFQIQFVGSPNPQYTVEFTGKDGKPWFAEDCKTNRSGQTVVDVWTPGAKQPSDERSTIDTGTYGFAIKHKDTGETIYQGKYKVTKFHYGPGIPMYKNQHAYVVDNDWNLPIGYLWLDMTGNDRYAPKLKFATWFRGEARADNVEGKLFYNGQEIATTKNKGEALSKVSRFSTLEDKPNTRYERWELGWYLVLGYQDAKSGFKYPGAHILDKNPGSYEIKVLRDGIVVREMQFTVGADGKIVDNGLAKQNNLGDDRMIFPLKVLGTLDGNSNQASWQVDAFYGNPVVGLSK